MLGRGVSVLRLRGGGFCKSCFVCCDTSFGVALNFWFVFGVFGSVGFLHCVFGLRVG